MKSIYVYRGSISLCRLGLLPFEQWDNTVETMASDVISAQSAMLFCTKHSTVEVEMYCRRCKTTTCTTCMMEHHLGHEVETIAKFSRNLTNNRAGFLGELTAKISKEEKTKVTEISRREMQKLQHTFK